jgi:hypothetical protein
MYPKTEINTKTRATNSEVEETRRVLKLIRPFLPALARWNEQLPRYAAILASPRAADTARRCALAEIEAMLGEIREVEAAFFEATASARSHSRVEDVTYSMSRIEARLVAVVAAAGRHAAEPAPIQRALPGTGEQLLDAAPAVSRPSP